MLDPIDRKTEQDLRERIDQDEIERHVDVFEGLERISGSDDEWVASEYVVETLDSYGVEAEVLEYEGYISVPEKARLEVTTPRNYHVEQAITTSFGASTPPAGVSGDIVHVPEVDEEHLQSVNVSDQIVFTEGLPTPDPIRILEAAGAKAAVFQSISKDYLHEMIVTPVWGTPSVSDAEQLPNLPVIEISQADGEWLETRLQEGPVEATVRTQVTTELTMLPCPIGWIDGAESDRYFLVGNHVDSWYEGITDNATAMATTLEIARIFADREPVRGLVFGFWSAHSTGRYAGSAWYADEYWLDLRENGVAYLHIDLNGLEGADSIWYQHMAELEAEHLDAIEQATDFPLREGDESWLGDSDRPARNSDQSFWGAGLSSLLSGARLTPGTELGGPIGGGWWWHTPEDTRERVDMDVLVEEAKLYVTIATRICESSVLPHDFEATAGDIRSVLDEIELEADRSFHDLHDRIDAFEDAIVEANGIIDECTDATTATARAAEDLQVDLGNILIPALYMERHVYEQEPALPHRQLPYLRIAEQLSSLSGRERRFAETTLRRGRNRLAGYLDDATERATRFVENYGR